MYENELKALRKAGRYRERKIFDIRLEDFASNDYLGLATNKKQFKKAVKLVNQYTIQSPKSSMLINGYHPIHKEFEETMARYHGFEKGLVVGSGYLANIALIEALVRKSDVLFIDEHYHASGIMASKLLGDKIITFKHNDVVDLKKKLDLYPAKRQIIAVEGVYSMGGDLCRKEIFTLADAYKAMMIVDEAHSAGVLGLKLLGIFEYYGIKAHERHIKMGTLGKAYGSYGAYILASEVVISFLVNRAKPVIYSTALSVFDTALALVNIQHIRKKSAKYTKAILERQLFIREHLGVRCESLIVPMVMKDNHFALYMQEGLMEQGYLVGAIRQPTVSTPILRISMNMSTSIKKLRHLLSLIEHNMPR